MRLLIAEDDRALGIFPTRGMVADGHRVRITLDGEDAVRAFRDELPGITIFDLNLPVIDVEQVLERFAPQTRSSRCWC